MRKVKKILALLLCLVLSASLLTSTVFAADEDNSYSEVLCFHITEDIEFDIEKGNLSDEQIKVIMNHFFGERQQQEPTRNLICTIFGHDYESTIATITTHNVYPTYPKCVKKTYEVSVCNRCDYSESVLRTSIRAGCCS